jgi:hypothetical protein
LVVTVAVLSACTRRSPAPPPAPALRQEPIQLHDVTAETGISFRHTDGSSGQYYIVETVSSGLATLDYDGDGLIDIYFPNGAPLRDDAPCREPPPWRSRIRPDTPDSAPRNATEGVPYSAPPRHALYRNLGAWRFKDVSDAAGVACSGYGLGAVVGDCDNDGRPDLYVCNFGPKVLYRNNGDGTFTDATGKAGVADGDKVGAGACFLDADGDGLLDLYVANYLKFDYKKHTVNMRSGLPQYVSPLLYPPEQHTLFRNKGDGTFADASVEAGIAQLPGYGMGIVAADFDNDGDTDIFVLNDASRNYFWKNDGKGHFEEAALFIGAAYNGNGESMASMGVDCADYDNDGWLDFFQTSYNAEMPVLFRNLADGVLEDVTVKASAAAGSIPYVKWGCGLVDFDNDGHRDLFVACGHLQDLIDRYDKSTSYHAPNVVLRNMGDGTFVNVSDRCGDGLLVKLSSRGAAFDDLDNDGDIDAVILNSRREPTILRNMYYESAGGPTQTTPIEDSGRATPRGKNHWLQIQLRGVKTNRDGVGARVRVTAGALVQVDEVHSGRGYQGHFGSRLHFGLGQHGRVDRIEVRWLGGGVDVIENVAADRLLTINED